MGPWYSGDGVGEMYPDQEFKDSSGTPILDLVNFFVSLNRYDPGPSVGFFYGRSGVFVLIIPIIQILPSKDVERKVGLEC